MNETKRVWNRPMLNELDIQMTALKIGSKKDQWTPSLDLCGVITDDKS